MDMRARLVEEFIALTPEYAVPGAVEFYFWEVIEGLTKPSFIVGPPSEEAMDIFHLMRDEEGFWVMWKDGQWQAVEIDEWRAIAAKRTFSQALREHT